MATKSRAIPPVRECIDCPKTFRAWAGLRCPDCFRALEYLEREESFSEWRARLKREGKL